jgi:hypothetical protein
MLKPLSAAAILVSSLVLSGAGARSQPMELKMHHAGGPGSLFSEICESDPHRDGSQPLPARQR